MRMGLKSEQVSDVLLLRIETFAQGEVLLSLLLTWLQVKQPVSRVRIDGQWLIKCWANLH